MKKNKKSLLGQTVKFLSAKFEGEPAKETKIKVLSFSTKAKKQYNIKYVKQKRKAVVQREALDRLFLINR